MPLTPVAFGTDYGREEEEVPSIQLLSERSPEPARLSPEDLYGEPEKSVAPEDLYGTPKISASEYILNETKRGLIDLLSTPGLAVDAAAEIVNTATELFRDEIPEIVDPRLGTEDIRKMLEDISFTKDYEPPSDEARYSGSIARYGAPAIVSGPFIAGIQGLTKLEKARAILTEAASALTGGVGAEVGADVAEEMGYDPETGRMLGGIVGTTAPLPAQQALSTGISRLKGMRSKEFQRQMGRAKVAAQLEAEIGAFPDAQKNLQRYKELSENIPGWSVSTGRATGAPGIISLERHLGEKSADYLEYAIKSDRQATTALQAKIAKDFPDVGHAIPKTVGKTYTRVSNKLKTDLDRTIRQHEQLGNRYVTQPSDAIGERLKELKTQAEESARGIKNMKYDALYAKADELGVSDNVTDIYDYVEKTVKQDEARFQGPNMPGVFDQILREFKAEQSPILSAKGQPLKADKEASFKKLHSLMKRASFEYEAAKRGNDPTLTKYLGDLKTKLQSHVDNYADPKFGEVSTMLKDANNFYRNEYQKVFKQGAGAKLTNFNKYGDTTPDEEVVRRVFLGRKQGLKDFFKIYGDSEEAHQLLKDGVLDVFHKAAVVDGKIIESRVHTFNKKYANMLNELPEVKAIIGDSVKLNQELIGRQATLRNKITALNGSTVKRLANVEDVDRLLERAMKNPKEMKTLTQLMSKEKNGVQALAHSVAVKIIDQKDPYQYFLDNKETLTPVLNRLAPGHAKNLSDIAEATSIMKRSEVPTKVSVSMRPRDIAEETIGTTFKSIFSQARAVSQGRVSQEYVMSDIGGKFLFTIKQREAERLLNVALYDPQLALDISNWSKKLRIVPGDVAKIKYHLYSTGALANVRYDEDRELPEEW